MTDAKSLKVGTLQPYGLGLHKNFATFAGCTDAKSGQDSTVLQ